MTDQTIYDIGLDKCDANFVSLSPLSFLPRAAKLFPNRTAWVDGEESCSWSGYFVRCKKLASALSQLHIKRGDTVAALLNNTHAMLECHFGVPATGAVINTLNTRLDASALAFMLGHGEASVFIVDAEFEEVAAAALELLGDKKPKVIVSGMASGALADEEDYEAFVESGSADYPWALPAEEWDAIALNYTSGTTGDPKGVVVHHRGAYLNAVTNALSANMSKDSVYLWTLPMFHCNGWCFPWTLALVGGTSICLRKVDPDLIFEMIEQHQVTHMCGAPIVYNTILNAAKDRASDIKTNIVAMLGGASPPAAVLEGCEKMGISIVHAYGLTEVYGPASMCVPQDGWEKLSVEDRAEKFSRQGVNGCLQEDMTVMDPDTMRPVPANAETIGEVMFRGNIVMKGYLKNQEATQKVFKDGWFHTGDLAVLDTDDYVKVVDRSKDIIISGGENISSVEVEDTLYRHPAVLFAAVVAKPDDKWGEVPFAFIECRPGMSATTEEIIEFCREHMARFKAPKHIEFCELPKTATGKIQKFVLREKALASDA